MRNRSRGDLELAYVEWNPDGRICRIVHTLPPSWRPNVLERMVEALIPRFQESDVDWCERDQRYYHHVSGGFAGRIYVNTLVGGRGKLWVAPGLELRADDGNDRELTPEEVSERGWDIIKKLDWRWDITSGNSMYDRPPGAEDTVTWCEVCEDMLPDGDPCDHIESDKENE